MPKDELRPSAIAVPQCAPIASPLHQIGMPSRLTLSLISGLTAPTVRDLGGEPRRVRVGDDHGRTLVAREYGGVHARAVLLPDGSLGWPNAPVYTEEAFRPFTPDELRNYLREGPYKHFRAHQTDHYLVFTQGSEAFARDSGMLLESLYGGLLKGFRENGLEVHEAEFPLVAVIFRRESDFREHKHVDPDVQAYYEAISNRIFLYETSDRDPTAAASAAMRRPQTVAHEGTHQILNNIGVQPRMGRWPSWLVEGLAELCAPTTTLRGAWAGFSRPNPFHLATIQELQDVLASQDGNARLPRSRVGREFGRTTVEYLAARDSLAPTDYALAWALTYYLANRKHDDFVAYLKEMGRVTPFVERTPEQNFATFRAAFKDDPQTLGLQAHRLIGTLRRTENFSHFAVIFEQAGPSGPVRRGTLVSQSPEIIRQWIEQMSASDPAPFAWEAWRYPSRSAASAAAERWLNRR